MSLEIRDLLCGRLRSRSSAFTVVAAGVLVACSSALGGDVWQSTRLNINLLPPNVVAYNGETKIYEAGGSITVGAGTFFTGSQVVLAAGNTISFLPGFLAQQGSTVAGIIDADHNGISDYLESVDTDGDGYFDALENYLGTSNRAQSHGFEIDINRDGIFDAIEDAMTLGTPSALGVSDYPTSDGYRSSLGSEIFPYGTSYSVTVSDGGYLYDRFLSGYLPSWIAENLHIDFSYTYNYYSFHGYYAMVFVSPKAQGDYGLYAMDPWLGWVPLAEFTRTGSQGYTFYTPLYEDVYRMPQFLQLVKYGVATPITVAGGFDILSILGAGEVDGNRLNVRLPQVLGLPESVANAVDWADILEPGGGSWNLDLDGDGVNEVTLNPLNLEGKVSIEVASTRVEISAHVGGGVYVSVGDFKVGQAANGQLEIELPPGLAGVDGQIKLAFSPPPVDITAFFPGPNGETVDEGDEDDPDKLILTTNDDYDEELWSAKTPENPDPAYRYDQERLRDDSDEKVDPDKELDYMRVRLRLRSGLSGGTVRLLANFGNNNHQLAPDFFGRIYSADGETRLGSGDFVLNLSNPQGALAPLASTGSVELLFEPTFDQEHARLALVYEPSIGAPAADELHFHIMSFQFQKSSQSYGFDDGEEFPIMEYGTMVPLPVAGSGSGGVMVSVAPASLIDKVELTIDNTSVATIPSSTLSSPNENIAITGLVHGQTDLVAKVAGTDVEIERLKVSVRRRKEIKLALFEVDLPVYPAPTMPFSNAQLIDHLNNTTWGKQANVYFSVLSGPTGVVSNYDVHLSDGKLDPDPNRHEVNWVTENSYAPGTFFDSGNGADVNIYLVNSILGDGPGSVAGFRIPGTNRVIVDIQSGLQVIAHEVGHALGLTNDDHSKIPGDLDLMHWGVSAESTHVRRLDWNRVNP